MASYELNLDHLKEDEKEKIKKVIERDKQLRNQHLNIDRIRELRKEISLIEANSPEIPNEHIKTASFCIRCKQSFSYGFGYIYYSLFGQASECSKCGYKICQQCRVYSSNTNGFGWLCILCHKKSELKQLLLKSGEWVKDEKCISQSQTVQINLEPEKKKDVIQEAFFYQPKPPTSTDLRKNVCIKNHNANNIKQLTQSLPSNLFASNSNLSITTNSMQDLDKCSQEINVKSTEDLSCSISEDSGLDLEAAERLAAESFTSIDSEFNEPAVPKKNLPNWLGRVEVTLEYDHKSSNLIIHIGCCENIKGLKDELYDTYIKMYLISNYHKTEKKEKSTKIKTTIKKGEANPQFNETFRLTIAFGHLAYHKIRAYVCQRNKLSRNKTLGKFDIQFCEEFNGQNLSSNKWYLFVKN